MENQIILPHAVLGDRVPANGTTETRGMPAETTETNGGTSRWSLAARTKTGVGWGQTPELARNVGGFNANFMCKGNQRHGSLRNRGEVFEKGGWGNEKSDMGDEMKGSDRRSRESRNTWP
jgi:hypothetical protein